MEDLGLLSSSLLALGGIKLRAPVPCNTIGFSSLLPTAAGCHWLLQAELDAKAEDMQELSAQQDAMRTQVGPCNRPAA